MARFYTVEDLGRRIAKGYGQGDGPSYQPWLGITDVPSSGKATRIKGRWTGRMHVFFSRIEVGAFLAAEWLDCVTDIREQFPLTEMDQVQEIADELGISLPRSGKLQSLIVPTTDLLLTIRDEWGGEGLQAIAVKPSVKLLESRVLELLEIERVYWNQRNVAWSIVTDAELPKPLIDNLLWISRYFHPDALAATPALIERIERVLFDRLSCGKPAEQALGYICAEVDDRLGLADGLGLCVLRHAVARKWWRTDLFVRIDPLKPPPMFMRDEQRRSKDLRRFAEEDVL